MRRQSLFIAIMTICILGVSVVLIPNLDILTRTLHSYQNGTLTMEKFRLDLASYNIGQPVPPIPSDAKISSKDEMVQVFVPAGEFTMGSGEEHRHKVYLDSFWMDRVEVTNSMYLKCMQAGGCTPPVSDNVYYNKWIYRNHPIVYIAWYQAEAYCEWTDRRLPTEAEWEKAARGTNWRSYPWGFSDPNPRLANYAETMIHESVSSFSYPLGASPYGVLNMSGNVREWVADWYDPHYYEVSPYANPKGPETGKEKSLRSGSYNEGPRGVAIDKRYRHEPQSAGLSRGFRCAQDADPGK